MSLILFVILSWQPQLPKVKHGKLWHQLNRSKISHFLAIANLKREIWQNFFHSLVLSVNYLFPLLLYLYARCQSPSLQLYIGINAVEKQWVRCSLKRKTTCLKRKNILTGKLMPRCLGQWQIWACQKWRHLSSGRIVSRCDTNCLACMAACCLFF